MPLFRRFVAKRRTGTNVVCRPGSIYVDSPALFGSAVEKWWGFVERLRRLPEISALEIDRARGTAVIRFAAGSGAVRGQLHRLSAALASDAESAPSSVSEAAAHLARIIHALLLLANLGVSSPDEAEQREDARTCPLPMNAVLAMSGPRLRDRAGS